MAETSLVLTHADDTGSILTTASLEAVTAGKELATQLGASIAIGIVAVDANAAAGALAGVVARILCVSGEAFAQARYASDAAACEALCKAANATIVLAPGSSRFARVIAGVAHRLGRRGVTLVLSTTHRGGDYAKGSAVDSPARCWNARAFRWRRGRRACRTRRGC